MSRGSQEVAVCSRPRALIGVWDHCNLDATGSRPHLALDGARPASRYQPSLRPFPDPLPEIVDDENATVVTVRGKGDITVQGRRVFVSQGLAGQPVGIEPTTIDGVVVARFCQQPVATIDLRPSS